MAHYVSATGPSRRYRCPACHRLCKEESTLTSLLECPTHGEFSFRLWTEMQSYNAQRRGRPRRVEALIEIRGEQALREIRQMAVQARSA